MREDFVIKARMVKFKHINIILAARTNNAMPRSYATRHRA
jgi:hypothetical protein